MEKLFGKLSSVGKLTGRLANSGKLAGRMAALNPWGEYSGATEVTPSAEEQTLHTAGQHMPSDIVIHPIPQNYGLITWNGSTITVS